MKVANPLTGPPTNTLSSSLPHLPSVRATCFSFYDQEWTIPYAGHQVNLSPVSRMYRALAAHTQLSSAQPDLTSLSLPGGLRVAGQVGARV